ncbi:E3 ubiquitin-protein ligase hrd1 [Orbilia brochopaga]|uniref:RING-type E3 ubiquitin transferase n=1 Tax=Orbilia brochopaga TaxID=3140254 RepID=A0AAV9UDN2_9PEZI
MMRLAVYGTVSTLVASGVVLQAFHQRANFYSACVHLAQSNACLMILTNFGFFMTLMFGKMVQKIFYGPLRPAEVEDLYEKAWYAITETFLAMTIFRDEFRGEFVAMFTVLLFLKCFHWLATSRVEFIQQTPPDRPYLFHARLASSLAILFILDFLLTRYSVLTLMQLPKPNMLVMFAFDFAILTINCSSVIARYLISAYEKVAVNRMSQSIRERKKKVLQTRVERGDITEEEMTQSLADDAEALDLCTWEAKSAWTFRANITSDVLKLLIYVAFFSIVLTFYGLPLHIIRDVYLTIRSFITKVRDYIAYKKATADMNSKYPDANATEIAREPLCIICRETMVAWSEAPTTGGRTAQVFVDDEGNIVDERMRPKKLPCGHVLHLMCLKSWMERQQRCPTCRRPVLDDPRHPQRHIPGEPPAGAIPAPANVNPAAQPPPPPPPGVPGGQGAQGPAHAGRGQQPPPPPFPNNMPQIPQAHGQRMAPGGAGINAFLPAGAFANVLHQNMAHQPPPLPQPPQPEMLYGTARQRQARIAHLQQVAQLNLQNDIQARMNNNTAAVAQVAVQEVVQQQQLWNQRMMHQMNLLVEEVRALRGHVPASTAGSAAGSATGAAGAAGSTTGTPAASVGGTPAQADRGTSLGPSPTPTTPLRSEVRPPPPPSSEASANISNAGSSTQPVPPSVLSPVPPASTAPSGSVDGAAAPDSNTQSPPNLLPPGFQLPPGWSIVPLYPVAQSGAGAGGGRAFATPQHIPTTVYTTPSPSSQAQQHQQHLHRHHNHQSPSASFTYLTPQPATSPAPVSDISLSTSGIRRRGIQRQYSSTLHAYHSMASPRREEHNPLAGASMGPPSAPQGPSSTTTTTTTTTATTAAGPTSPLASPATAAQTANIHSYGPPSASPSRHGSVSSTSREVLERRHREAHSPRSTSHFSPPGHEGPTSNPHQESTIMGALAGSAAGSVRRPELPTMDTSAEHNHPLDATHDPTQGRSPVEERRRASAGEILLSETDTVWPAPPVLPGSVAVSEASSSPNPSLPSSRTGSLRRRNRRSSNATMTIPPGSGSPVGTTGMFNVIPRSQTNSTVGSPVMGHTTAALNRLDVGSPSRMSLDREKEKDEGPSGGAGGADDGERGRSRSKEKEAEK